MLEVKKSQLSELLAQSEIARVDDTKLVLVKDGCELELCETDNASTLYECLELFQYDGVKSLNFFQITINLNEDDGNTFVKEDVEIYLDLDDVCELIEICQALKENQDVCFGGE